MEYQYHRKLALKGLEGYAACTGQPVVVVDHSTTTTTQPPPPRFDIIVGALKPYMLPSEYIRDRPQLESL
jgi:hypothetical protein